MNKIFKVKRNSAGQSVVCSEIAKSRTKGRVVASALALAVSGVMVSGVAGAASGTFVNNSGTYVSNAPDNQVEDMKNNSVVLGNSTVIADTLSNGMTNQGVVVLSGHITDRRTDSSRLLINGKAQREYWDENRKYFPYSSNPTTGGATHKSHVAVLGTASNIGGIAVGAGSTADGGIAIGSDSASFNTGSIALGEGAGADRYNMAIGHGAVSLATDYSVALGSYSVTTADNQVSVGNRYLKRKIVNIEQGAVDSNSTEAVTGAQLYTVKQEIRTGLRNTISYDVEEERVGELLGNVYTKASITLKEGEDRAGTTIKNVANGDESANSTDAVNGSQLFAVKQSVSDLKTAIGNLSKESTEVKKGDGVTVTSETKDNVTTYTVAVDKDVITNAVKTEVQTIKNGVISYGTKADGSIDMGAISLGDGKNNTTIKNVANGDVAETSTDAVNGSQLFAVKQSVSDLKTAINNLPKESTKVKKGDGVTVTQKTDGDVTTYTVAVDENVIATKDYVKNHVTTEIGKIQTKIQESIGDANEKYVDDEIGKLNNKLSTQISEKANQSDLTELDKRVGGVEKQLESKADQGYVVDELAKKANKDDLEKLEGKINTSIQADLKDKADRIEVENLLKGKANKTDLKELKDDITTLIKDKADKTDDVINTLTGRVTTTEKDIENLKDTKADKIDVENQLKGKVDQATQKIVDGDQDKRINDLTAVSVTYDDTVKDTITLAGAEGTTIKNVADGKVAAGSKDAVNGGQLDAINKVVETKADKGYVTDELAKKANQSDLKATNDRQDNFENRMNGFEKYVGKMEERLDGGIANAMALANLPTPYEPGSHHIMFGSGFYSGQSAFALGASGTNTSGKSSYKAGLSWSETGGFGGGVGASYRWK